MSALDDYDFVATVPTFSFQNMNRDRLSQLLLENCSMFIRSTPVPPDLRFSGLDSVWKPAIFLQSSSFSAECNLLLKERLAQRFVLRCTLHRACLEWKQLLKMVLIRRTSMHYSHAAWCVCFMCVCVRLIFRLLKHARFFYCCSHRSKSKCWSFTFLSFILPILIDGCLHQTYHHLRISMCYHDHKHPQM